MRRTRARVVIAASVLLGASCSSSSERNDATSLPPTHLCAPFGAPPPPPPPTTCSLDVVGNGTTVRVFAVGDVQDLRDDLDYATYCEAIDRVVRERVAPCLSNRAPNLVVFPDEATFAASFLGARGANARTETEVSAAFADLARSYEGAIGWYEAQFAHLDSRRALGLALTDTTWRVLHGVFAAMAKRYGVYVAVGANVSSARETTDTSAIEALGDPEASGPTYVATSPEVWNASVVFSPDGSLVGFEKKAYLAPDEEASSDLSYGPLEALDPIHLPFGRVGVSISKDAWMPIVRDRFDAWGVEVALQHEAFSGWAIGDRADGWPPDVVMESAYAMTQRSGATRVVIAPMLAGNLFDRVFDGQTHVTKIPAPDDAPLAFIGEPPSTGFFAIAPWADATDTDRPALAAYAESLRPGGLRAGAYVGGVVAVDLDLHVDGQYPPPKTGSAASDPGIFGSSFALVSSLVPQRHIALTARGSHAYAAWEEGAPGGGDIRVATFEAGSFAAPQTISSGHARLPSIGIFDPGEVSVAVAWEQDAPDGSSSVYVATQTDGGSWSSPGAVPSAGAAQWAPWIAGTRFSGLYVGWHDLRDGGRSHVYVMRLASGTIGPLVRVDPMHTDTTTRGDEWSMRMIADDRAVHVAWIDFRDFSWDVRYASSLDRGATFSPSQRLNDPTPSTGAPPVELERLESDVTIALDLAGAPLVGWTAMQEQKPFPWVASDRPSVGGGAGRDTFVGESDHWVQPALAFDGTGKGHVVAVSNGAIVLDDPSRRVSDAPVGAHATRPRMTIVGDSTVIIAWEDDRDGPTAIRYVVGSLP
jgi:predicted amidohydrolase